MISPVPSIPGDRSPSCLGIDVLMQYRRPVAPDGGYLLVRGAASLKLGKICFAILIERSQAGANEVIRPETR